MSYFPFGAGTYYLGSSIGSTDSTILLSSFTEPVTETPYTMALINSTIVYATIAPKTSSSEFISFTGITQNANGTATLTGVTRGLAKKYPFTSNSTYKQPHSGQSTFIISDVPQVFESFMTLANSETITGIKTFGTGATPLITDAPITALMAANKAYVDSVAIAGAPNASTAVQGLVQQATTAQVNAGTATGSTGAKLFASPADLAASIYGLQLPSSTQKDALAGTGTPSGSNKFVTADTDALKQLLSNLSTTTTLGSSDTLYPSQNAVKTYVDTTAHWTYISSAAISANVTIPATAKFAVIQVTVSYFGGFSWTGTLTVAKTGITSINGGSTIVSGGTKTGSFSAVWNTTLDCSTSGDSASSSGTVYFYT